MAALTASRSTRPSDSGLVTASELKSESEFGVEFGPDTALAGVAPINPANSAKLSMKSPVRFALGKILTPPIYASQCQELAHRNPRTAQESRVR